MLKSFLADARAIAQGYGVRVGLDIFGYAIVSQNDLGVGHSFRELAEMLDVVSPMVYPSHYIPGNFGFEKPQNHPFEIVSQSIRKANEAVGGKCLVRPWVQAFGWNTPTYSEDYIIEELRGVLAGGSTSYLVWNANNDYGVLFKSIKKMVGNAVSSIPSLLGLF